MNTPLQRHGGIPLYAQVSDILLQRILNGDWPLGASLPAAEIAGVAHQRRARAVALSLVYPDDDPRLEGELTLLRESLPADVKLLVGGRAMPAYRDACEKAGALPIENLAQLGATLDNLRKPARRARR